MKPCLSPGCPNVVGRGAQRCDEHDLGPWDHKRTFQERYGVTRSEWAKIRARVIRRDHGRCVDCSSRQRLEADHIVPVSQGGSSDLDNLATRCRTCHQAKTNADRKVSDG